MCPFMTLDGTRATVVSQGCRRVSSLEGGFPWALLSTPAPVRRSLSSLIAVATATFHTTATLIATTTLRLTTLRLTRNAPMSVIAWRIRLTRPKGATGGSLINLKKCPSLLVYVFSNVWNTEPKR